MTLAFIQPRKPAQGAFIERIYFFNRESVQDAYRFEIMAEPPIFTEDWLEDYNAIHPNEALGGILPFRCGQEKRRISTSKEFKN